MCSGDAYMRSGDAYMFSGDAYIRTGGAYVRIGDAYMAVCVYMLSSVCISRIYMNLAKILLSTVTLAVFA